MRYNIWFSAYLKRGIYKNSGNIGEKFPKINIWNWKFEESSRVDKTAE
jgi:hypothetical protein